MRTLIGWTMAWMLVAATVQVHQVQAQESANEDASAGAEPATAVEPLPGAEESTEVAEDRRSATDPYEDPQQGYWFIGGFYRHMFAPKAVLDLFTQRSTGANNPGAGIQLTYRKDNFSVSGNIWWQSYAMEGAFLGPGEPPTDVEWVESDMSIYYLGANFLWSAPLSDVFAFEYGVGFAVGLVQGDLVRTEAYPDGEGYAPCNGPLDPSGSVTGDPFYCEEMGGHYDHSEPKWLDGGYLPNLWIWAALPHVALRIKPIHQVVLRIEGGLSTGGLFAGASAEYGL